MATDKEYQALIKALSGECERLHKAIESIRTEIDEQIIPRSSHTDRQKKEVLKIIDRYSGRNTKDGI